MRKTWIEEWNYRRYEVTVVNSERVYIEGTRDVMVKLNCENSNAVKIVKDVLYVQD
jgi:hypothetical protein